MRWPALTLLGITCAVLIGIVHAGFKGLSACILGEEDLRLAPRDIQDVIGHIYEDGYAVDGYGNQ